MMAAELIFSFARLFSLLLYALNGEVLGFMNAMFDPNLTLKIDVKLIGL